jgi:glucan exporter ATP-binding protein
MTYANLFGRALDLMAPFRRVALGLIGANAIIGILSLAEPIVLGKMIDAFSDVAQQDTGDLTTVAPFFLLWAAFGIATVVISFFAGLHADKMSQRLRIRSIELYTKRALDLPIAYHERHASSYAFQTLLDGSSTFWTLIFSFFRDNCAAFVLLIMLCPTLLLLNWRLALPIIALVLSVYVLFSVALFYVERAQVEVDKKNSRIIARAADLLSHLKLISAFGTSTTEIKHLAELQKEYLQAQEPLLTFWAGIVTAGRAASMISILVVFGVGFWLMTKNLTTIGEVVSFAFIAQIAISRLDAISVFLTAIFQQKPKLEKFFEMMTIPAAYEAPALQAPERLIRGDVAFENVSFNYPNGNAALKNVSFRLEPCSMTALVGKSGSGKTTVLSLLCRFYEPKVGRILIGGNSLNSLPLQMVRQNIAVMFQDPMILSRSFEENVRYGSDGASWREVENAMRSTLIYDLYLREKEATSVQNGADDIAIGLSGGERQRLSLARVLLKNSPIILLDEPTSAADSATETEIQAALEKILRGKTSLVIAHRLSTIKKADQIVVLDQGEVIEIGTYTELLEKDGLFSELLRQQFSPEKTESSLFKN